MVHIYSSPINQKAIFTPVPGDQAGLKFSGGYVQKLNTPIQVYITYILHWNGGNLHSLAKTCVITLGKQGVCHTVWPCHLHKKYLQAKEELWETQIFLHAKI